jgi:hypothetical protein
MPQARAAAPCDAEGIFPWHRYVDERQGAQNHKQVDLVRHESDPEKQKNAEAGADEVALQQCPSGVGAVQPPARKIRSELAHPVQHHGHRHRQNPRKNAHQKGAAAEAEDAAHKRRRQDASQKEGNHAASHHTYMDLRSHGV